MKLNYRNPDAHPSPQVLMWWHISKLFRNETTGNDIVISQSRSFFRFWPNGATFPLLCSKNDLSHYWVFSQSFWTCMHALKPFHINEITALADGLML